MTAYTAAYADVQTVTNSVLDIVVPYERIVIRYATIAPSVKQQSASGTKPASGTQAASTANANSVIKPELFKDTAAAAAAVGNPAPSAAQPASGTNANSVIKPELFKDPAAAAAAAGQPTPKPALQRVERRCKHGYGGPDPFCYEMRDGYADIGDPPLVGAYRNLSNVVLRFNTLLVAYSEGISGRLLQQELDGLTSSVNELSKIVPLSGAFARNFSDVVGELMPVAKYAAGMADRAELREFLLRNHRLVDRAIQLMAVNSVELYANVAVGTQMYPSKDAATLQNLNARRREIRRLIANWTVLLDDMRRLLRELILAIEHSDGIETRIRNLDSTVMARIDTTAIKKQIATLGTPVLPP